MNLGCKAITKLNCFDKVFLNVFFHLPRLHNEVFKNSLIIWILKTFSAEALYSSKQPSRASKDVLLSQPRYINIYVQTYQSYRHFNAILVFFKNILILSLIPINHSPSHYHHHHDHRLLLLLILLLLLAVIQPLPVVRSGPPHLPWMDAHYDYTSAISHGSVDTH